ncbi:YjbF family lipoprotein [Oceanomicrobium pacificus]|uniref:Group 4 capsule polysaccharide lipoprotein gfcB, YjbF n=1 Tax=Oceanomicrobium pacificus TaxID=2692916 RepID=A0A6B0TVP8_9RHOB|nr:YjbF family lipoprotein [Oceanomicrobium pacificus]MXU65063.1 hypothetical protein [Oceanomicrobium pacificus]
MSVRSFLFLLPLLFGACTVTDLDWPGQTQTVTVDTSQIAAAKGQGLIVQLVDRGTANRFRPVGRINGVVTWAAPDGVSVSLRDGMVVNTAGLAPDLFAADTSGVRLADAPASYTRVMRYLDGEDRIALRSYHCDLTDRGPRQIPFGSGMVMARQMVEDCGSSSHAFENLYFLDSDGRILGSRQWLGDGIGTIILIQQDAG